MLHESNDDRLKAVIFGFGQGERHPAEDAGRHADAADEVKDCRRAAGASAENFENRLPVLAFLAVSIHAVAVVIGLAPLPMT